jgi:hypothetical protein
MMTDGFQIAASSQQRDDISMIKMRVVLAFAAVFSFSALLARADSETILSVSQAGPSTPVGGCNYCPSESQYVGIAFELDHPFQDVAITIPRVGFNTLFSGTAWLTDAIGPLTTPNNVLASKPFSLVSSSDRFVNEDYTFLSELDLSPGTYYFFLSSPVCVSDCADGTGFWPGADATSTVFTAPGISSLGTEYSGGFILPGCGNPANCPPANSNFPPASSWRFGPEGQAIDITASGHEVPEPETILLVLTGLLLTVVSRLQRRAFKRK